MSMFLWISVFNYSCFYGYPFGHPLDFYGYPCIDLLWILDPGFVGKPEKGPAEIIHFRRKGRFNKTSNKKASNRIK